MQKPLVIGVDIRDLRVSKTGTKTYLEELCHEFKTLQSEDIQFRFIDSSLPVYSGSNKLLKLAEHLKYQLWKQIGLPLKALFNRCDIVFCTDNFVPLVHLGYETIPVFHDAFFFENPENYGRVWLNIYKKTALPAAKRSAFVITPTFYAQRQIHHFTGIPFEKLSVVYEAPKSGDDSNSPYPSILEKLNLKPSAYLLHVGAMFKRKNLPFLIKAFANIKKEHPELKLVLAGPKTVSASENDFDNIKNTITSAGLENEVLLPGYLADAELSQLYNCAIAYLFPSLNEGFGIPVLEAFKHGLPTLVANNTCLPEVGGDAVIKFDPFDETDLFNKLKMVLDNQQLRAEMISKGAERLNEFSWPRAALQLIDIFKQAARHS